MVMLGTLLSNLPRAGSMVFLGVELGLPEGLPKYFGTLEVAGFLLLVAGLFHCLKAPLDSQSRHLMLSSGVALVLLQFLSAPALVGLTWHRFLPLLHLAVELALLLALCRLAVYYRRRDLLGSYFAGAGLATFQALLRTMLIWGFFRAHLHPLLILSLSCLAGYALLVSLATGRLAVSAGEGPPKEDHLA